MVEPEPNGTGQSPSQGTTDAHVELTHGFRTPRDAHESMGLIERREHVKWFVIATRFSGRASMNQTFLEDLETYMLLSRSQEGYGSEQASRVASQRATLPMQGLPIVPAPPPPPEPQKRSIIPRIFGKSTGGQ